MLLDLFGDALGIKERLGFVLNNEMRKGDEELGNNARGFIEWETLPVEL